MDRWTGRTALVTGASRGLGVHMARALARQGVHLALTARSADALEEVGEEIRAEGVEVAVVPADLSVPDEAAALVEEVEQALGPVDVLVSNAGVSHAAPYGEIGPDVLERTVGVNLLAPMLLARAVLPGMLERGRGHIVNVSSLAGKIGFPFQTPYAATKAGLIMLTHSLRTELVDAPVGVSVVCPGFVEREGMYARKVGGSESASGSSMTTTPERVADAVLRCIRDDVPEVVVNPLPVRPLTVLTEMAPGLVPRVHRWFGTFRLGRAVSEKRREEEDDSG